MESLGKEFDLDGNRVIFFPYSSQFTVTDISEPLGFRFFIHYCFCLTYKFPMTGESRANCIWQQRKHWSARVSVCSFCSNNTIVKLQDLMNYLMITVTFSSWEMVYTTSSLLLLRSCVTGLLVMIGSLNLESHVVTICLGCYRSALNFEERKLYWFVYNRDNRVIQYFAGNPFCSLCKWPGIDLCYCSRSNS